jgi:hypothetical protein
MSEFSDVLLFAYFTFDGKYVRILTDVNNYSHFGNYADMLHTIVGSNIETEQFLENDWDSITIKNYFTHEEFYFCKPEISGLINDWFTIQDTKEKRALK